MEKGHTVHSFDAFHVSFVMLDIDSAMSFLTREETVGLKPCTRPLFRWLNKDTELSVLAASVQDHGKETTRAQPCDYPFPSIRRRLYEDARD